LNRILMLAQEVDLHPNPSKLPGGNVLESLTDGIGGWALIFSLMAFVIGAAMWGFGHMSNNYQQTVVGKRAFGVSALAALLISGAPAIINFFYKLGQNI
jgi:hypothetical protein